MYKRQAYYVTEVLPIMKKQGTDAYFLFTVSIGGLQPGMRIQSAYTCLLYTSRCV